MIALATIICVICALGAAYSWLMAQDASDSQVHELAKVTRSFLADMDKRERAAYAQHTAQREILQADLATLEQLQTTVVRELRRAR